VTFLVAEKPATATSGLRPQDCQNVAATMMQSRTSFSMVSPEISPFVDGRLERRAERRQ
jgi:hypothetical protein